SSSDPTLSVSAQQIIEAPEFQQIINHLLEQQLGGMQASMQESVLTDIRANIQAEVQVVARAVWHIGRHAAPIPKLQKKFYSTDRLIEKHTTPMELSSLSIAAASAHLNKRVEASEAQPPIFMDNGHPVEQKEEFQPFNYCFLVDANVEE
ncbi:hypothetical protein HAX54_027626, partial [Datura stramonium]|nr:hypothetical protein [Datura stramonium]